MSQVEERSPSKTQLPFRLSPNPYGPAILFIEYEEEIDWHGKRKIPMQISVEAGPDSAVGSRIKRLMEMYWELEKTVCGLEKERDESKEALAKAEGEIETLRRQVQGYKNAGGKK